MTVRGREPTSSWRRQTGIRPGRAESTHSNVRSGGQRHGSLDRRPRHGLTAINTDAGKAKRVADQFVSGAANGPVWVARPGN